jgi:ABC-type multidrug transport system ATPase subunit
MKHPLIQFHNVGVAYPGSVSSDLVLSNITVGVNHGDWIMIRGRNGSGKSTLFKMLVGDLELTTGSIDRGHGDLPIFSVCQDPVRNSPASFTAAQALWVCDRHPPKRSGERRTKYQNLLAHYELDRSIDVLIGNLSGGQRQLVSMLMASLNEPKLLLLDEPTASLDPTNEAKCIEIVTAINRAGTTVLQITHDAAQFKDLGNRRWEISNANIREVGKP